MVKLPDGCTVAADQVAEIKVTESKTGVTVRTKNGIGHYIDVPDGSVYRERDRLVELVDKALEAQYGVERVYCILCRGLPLQKA
jgi:hypothetical protein